MRINNPKSLAGFTTEQNVDERAYKLATIGQLKVAISNVNKKFETLLRGAPGTVNYENETRTNGMGGLTNKCGYAWLNTEGKVDPTLLPALAITETHVITEAALKAGLAANDERDVHGLLNQWCKDHTTKVDAEHSLRFQKGDIIIVTPNETIANDTTIEATTVTPETRNYPDPTYAGTYIITNVPASVISDDPTSYGETSDYTFAKMSYTDSHIVRINDLSPETSLGALTIQLHDILKTHNAVMNAPRGDTALEAANTLEQSVYRLYTFNEGAAGYRFGFVDNSDESANPHIVKYAKLQELEDETEARILNDEFLSGKILELSGWSKACDVILQDEVDFLSGTVGNKELSLPDSAASGSVISQIKALRNDVDYNAALLDQSRIDTGSMLVRLQHNIDSLNDHFDGKAVTIIEKEIIWGANNTNGVLSTVTAPTTGDDSVIYDLLYNAGNADQVGISGYIVWQYEYKPTNEGYTSGIINDTIVNFENSKTLPGNNVLHADERILAVYDQEGNKIEVDLNRSKTVDPNTGMYNTTITVQTDFIGYDDETGAYKNTLVGQKWTLLIAKTILGTSNIAVPNDVKIGGNMSASARDEWNPRYPLNSTTASEQDTTEP